MKTYLVTTKKVKGFIHKAKWMIHSDNKKNVIKHFLGEFTQYKKKHILKLKKI